MFALSHKIAVYVPSTLNVSESADSSLVQSLVGFTSYALASLFGGVTCLPALGSYVAADGSLVTEQVTLVQSYVGIDAYTLDNLNQVFSIARTLCQVMSQECIGVEVDGKFYLVESSDNLLPDGLTIAA